MYVVRHGHPPRSQEGPGACVKYNASATTYFMITRNHTRTRTRSPFVEILIPEGNEGHEETGNKEESDQDNALLNQETWKTTSTNEKCRTGLGKCGGKAENDEAYLAYGWRSPFCR